MNVCQRHTKMDAKVRSTDDYLEAGKLFWAGTHDVTCSPQ